MNVLFVNLFYLLCFFLLNKTNETLTKKETNSNVRMFNKIKKKFKFYLVQHFVTNLQKRWSAEKKVSINIFMT